MAHKNLGSSSKRSRPEDSQVDEQLTRPEKKIKCSVLKLDEEQSAPLILEFPNNPPPSSIFSDDAAKLSLYSRPPHQKKFTVETDQFLYTGTNVSQEAAELSQRNKYFIGVHHKPTGTMKIIEVPSVYVMFQTVKNYGETVQEHMFEDNNTGKSALIKKFTSVRKQNIQRNLENNLLTEDRLVGLSDIVDEQSTTFKNEAPLDNAPKSYLPPYNEETSLKSEIYNVSDIVPDKAIQIISELDYNFYNKIKQDEFNMDELPSIVQGCLLFLSKKYKKLGEPKKKEKSKKKKKAKSKKNNSDDDEEDKMKDDDEDSGGKSDEEENKDDDDNQSDNEDEYTEDKIKAKCYQIQFLSYLIKYATTHATDSQGRRKMSVDASQYRSIPKEILNIITEKFAIVGGASNKNLIRTQQTDLKLIAHICVLALILSEYQLVVNVLAADLRQTLFHMQVYLQNVGCRIVKPPKQKKSNTNNEEEEKEKKEKEKQDVLAFLKAPLKFPGPKKRLQRKR